MFDHHLNETECFTMCDQLFIVFQTLIKHARFNAIEHVQTRGTNEKYFCCQTMLHRVWLPVIFCLDETGLRCPYDVTPVFLAVRNLLEAELSFMFFLRIQYIPIYETKHAWKKFLRKCLLSNHAFCLF